MSTESLKVVLIQAQTIWHQPEVNFKNCTKLLAQVSDADLILLPEMWSTGYTMQAHKYEASSGSALDLMKDWSLAKNAAISGSLIIKEEGQFLNRLFVVQEGAVIHTYDKKHLFAYAGEDRIYVSGHKQLIFDLNGWKICGNICYYIRFPVWSRNTSDYDLLFYVANWPDPRLTAWDTLLKARAIENQCYVLGVNCCGEDIWSNAYSGHSAIIDTFGNSLSQELTGEGILTCTLTKNHIDQARAKFPFLEDRDRFQFL